MKDKNTSTQQNLMTAFLRECGAYMEYTFYAEQANAEGYREIYNTFNKFANNEKAHAKVWFKLFHAIKDTKENLIDARDLEHYENSTMYVEFYKKAEEEGFTDIAALFKKVAEIEKMHEKEYNRLYKQLNNDTFFTKAKSTTWQCLNCGNIIDGETPPDSCPVCSYPKGYFTEKQS